MLKEYFMYVIFNMLYATSDTYNLTQFSQVDIFCE